ncbi:WD40 repeat domain-containing protein [Streptomyces radiopugnans]|uniref:WD domain-containing protein, G-beta repeat-containing protein n=1 Tax=Streptomyces radiopugnans TaxID=403935 RepID=A0A1H9B478_9ACTN|nr:hypothetical protein [Streptomyces radiopugnans]SEP83473.1 WD domain-containing protein, G-beta repeat-containing protein [Streptomyces radiopugnans]
MTLADPAPAGAGDGRRRALPASVVRITADGGATAGTGFLVAADTVVTCAHVVRAAGGEPGGRVHVRDVGNGTRRQTMAGRVDDPGAAAFSPKGDLLAVADCDDRLRLWDVATGEALESLSTGSPYWAGSVVFAPDGDTLAAIAGGRVRLWDVRSGRVRATPAAGHRREVYAVAFAPDGRLAVVGGGDPDRISTASGGEVQVWEVEAAEVRQAFSMGRSERRGVVEVAFARDGRTVAVSDFLPDGKAQVWDAETGVLRGTLPADGGSGEGPEFSGADAPADGRPCLATSMEFDPGGAVLAVGCEDGGFRLWDVGTGRVRDTLTGHRGAVDSVVFGPGGLIATEDGKGTRVWEAPVLGPEEMAGKICESLSSNRWPIRRQSFPTHRLPDWVCSP